MKRTFLVTLLFGLLAAALAHAEAPSGITRPSNERQLSDPQLGAQLYAGNCASCHGVAGQGVRRQGEGRIEAPDEDPGAPAHSSGTPAGSLGGTFLASNPSSRSKSFSSLKSL